MTRLRALLLRLLSSLSGRSRYGDLDDEIAFHLEMETRRHLARGLPEREARRAARRSFGSFPSTRQRYHDQAGLPAVDALVQDVRFALRLLARQPAFTAAAVLTLALGIGANTAIFSVVNGVLLEPLPFDGAERIVTVWEDFSTLGGPEQEWIEVPNLFEWQSETSVFETMVGYGFGAVNLTGRGDARRLTRSGVSYGFFRTFGTAPAIGRDFLPADDLLGADPVAILADGFWRRELAADPAVIGQTLLLDGEPTVVIGVAPAGFEFPGTPTVDLWTPLRLDRATATRGNFFLQGLARLTTGVTVPEAQDRLNAVMARIGETYPEHRGVTVRLVPLLDQIATPVRAGLLVLLALVALLLLIACANIANLMLSRGAGRARELAVRTALGAGRARVARQLLTESLVVSLLGSAVGVLLAAWSTKALLARVPSGLAPRLDNVSVDGTVLLVTLATAIAAGLLFGLAPVVQMLRHDPHTTLKTGGRAGRGADGGRRLRFVLAAGQVGLALILVIASGLAVRSFSALMTVEPGFDPEGLTTAFVSMPGSEFDGASELVGFLDGLLTRLDGRPGIESVAAVSVLPFGGNDADTSFSIEGRPDLDRPGSEPVAWFRRVTPSYFRAMRLEVLRGRPFDDGDRAGRPGVVMISDVTAERFWPGEDALGKRIRFGDGEWQTIIGITRGVHHRGPSQPLRPELYLPFAQRPGRAMSLVVRSALDPAAVAELVRAELRAVNRNLPLSAVTTMRALMSDTVAQPRFVASLTTLCSLLALTLASIGVYGVLSYQVTRRSGEMGLRMALGASRGQVLSMVLAQGLRVTAAGLVGGLLSAFWATRLVSGLLYEVEPRDLLTFTVGSGILVAAALAAAVVPALRATRIDPALTLRNE